MGVYWAKPTLGDIAAQRAMIEWGNVMRERKQQNDQRERLRDTFAAAALTGLLSNIPRYQLGVIAVQAYDIADEMLAERSRTGKAAEYTPPQSRAGQSAAEAVPEAAKCTERENAAPEARARDADRGRTDKAVTRPGDGTGNTPSKAEIDALEFVVEEGRIGNYGILRSWLIRLRPEWESPEPIKEGDSDRSQPIGSPAKTNPTQPRDGTPAEGSVPGEGSVPDSRSENEPVAWAVEKNGYPPMFAVFNDWNFACRAAMKEYAEIVPLYRHPPCQDLLQKNFTLTAEEREAVEWYAAYGAGHHADTLRKLLNRMGGVQ